MDGNEGVIYEGRRERGSDSRILLLGQEITPKLGSYVTARIQVAKLDSLDCLVKLAVLPVPVKFTTSIVGIVLNSTYWGGIDFQVLGIITRI